MRYLMSSSGLARTFVRDCDGTGEEGTELLAVGKVSVTFEAKLFWAGRLGTTSLATGGSAGMLFSRVADSSVPWSRSK